MSILETLEEIFSHIAVPQNLKRKVSVVTRFDVVMVRFGDGRCMR
jgi:hypothetical protein